MTTHLHGRLARIPTIRSPWLVPLLVVPLLLLAACAAPGGLVPPGPAPEPIAAIVVIEPAAVAAPAPAASAATTAAASPAPIDPLRPEVDVELDDRSAQVDLWLRMREGFAMPNLDNDLVRDQERWYASRPDYVQRMTERGSRYLFHVVEELDRRGMPLDLAMLPFIESAFNPQAMSTAKASGMWQFVPATGRHFLLTQNVFRDDRRDVLASTRAALDYLDKLHGMFGDWHLALAAYNWGEGNVRRAIARNEKLGLGTDYASLKMPDETRSYVPKLQAVKNIIARPADFGLTLPVLMNHPYFLSVPIDRDIDVAVAVELAGMQLEEFRTLNPQMNQPVILAAGTPQVLLPYDNANQFVRRLPHYTAPLATWTAWVAPKTLPTSEAARRVGMSEAQLREINRIPPRMLVRAGSTLVVPRGDQRLTDVSSEVADNATMSLAPDSPALRKLSLRAGRSDSVSSVAKRYRVSAQQVALWNGVTTSARFKHGDTIIVYVANKSTRSKSARKASPRSTAKSTSKQSTSTAAAPHKAGKRSRSALAKSPPRGTND
ncbi:MAG: transglycosylase SLT domain-containing protein [Burkholderiaceae bacterium]